MHDAPPSKNIATGYSDYVSGRERGDDEGKRNGKKITVAELTQATLTNPNRSFGKAAHWSDAHDPDR